MKLYVTLQVAREQIKAHSVETEASEDKEEVSSKDMKRLEVKQSDTYKSIL
jgi:hypothetical protein